VPAEYAIETVHLSKTYTRLWKRREIRALDDVSLKIERGTTFGLLGPNGAGKTTLVKLLLSSVHPTAGSAAIFGCDSRSTEGRRPIGYLPENHRFPTYMTGGGMLDFYGALSGMDARARQKRIPELLELVGLSEWHSVRLRKYSKGMLQRLGLAQALMHRPELLILDEPSDGVDPVGRKQIRELLHDLEGKGVTIFLNSHLLGEVELFCREIAILDHGGIALIGKTRELTAGKGYRLKAANVPERLAEELRSQAAAAVMRDELFEFQFATREEVNQALDLLRARQCEVESILPTTSTLEEIFMRTVNA
jgi:ABC-2 type transport system ATP-binding protein